MITHAGLRCGCRGLDGDPPFGEQHHILKGIGSHYHLLEKLNRVITGEMTVEELGDRMGSTIHLLPLVGFRAIVALGACWTPLPAIHENGLPFKPQLFVVDAPVDSEV